jgi:hypothetical protein
MTARGKDNIRAAVAGADRALSVIEGGRGKGPPPTDTHSPDEAGCPVTPVGHIGGTYVFLDRAGQRRDLTARQLGSRHDLLSLFGHNDRWLRWKFPKTVQVKKQAEDGTEVTDELVVDFILNKAAAHLGSLAFEAGMIGEHLVFRGPGVWPESEFFPAVHCGDMVRIGTEWRPAGQRSGNTFWAAQAAVPRPEGACDASIACELQTDIQNLFRFREAGSAIAVLGVLGTAYFGAAAKWRSACFLVGPAGCGKSSLLEVLAACCPLNTFLNDTTAAGTIGRLNGRAMPCFLDENEKTGDDTNAKQLLDLLLTATGGAGTRGSRGTSDGGTRTIEMVASFIMAATAAPPMKDTHLGRITVIEMMPPDNGEDYKDKHQELIAKMRTVAAQLWGRALGAWERYQACITAFRKELQDAGCAPREMDQMGAILAGWWILTHEGLPDARGLSTGILALAGLVRTADVVRQEGNSRRLAQYLLSYAVMLDRSTDREPIAGLMGTCLKASLPALEADRRISVEVARHSLQRIGIRVIRADEPLPAPRCADGAGIFFATGSRELAGLFTNSEWAGTRWQIALREMPSAKTFDRVVAFGDFRSRAIWVSAVDLQLEDPPDPPAEEWSSA